LGKLIKWKIFFTNLSNIILRLKGIGSVAMGDAPISIGCLNLKQRELLLLSKVKIRNGIKI